MDFWQILAIGAVVVAAIYFIFIFRKAKSVVESGKPPMPELVPLPVPVPLAPVPTFVETKVEIKDVKPASTLPVFEVKKDVEVKPVKVVTEVSKKPAKKGRPAKTTKV